MGIIWIENVGRGKQKETQQEAANLDSFFETVESCSLAGASFLLPNTCKASKLGIVRYRDTYVLVDD